MDLDKNEAEFESVEKERAKKVAALNVLKTNIKALEIKRADAIAQLPEIEKKLVSMDRDINAKEDSKAKVLEDLNGTCLLLKYVKYWFLGVVLMLVYVELSRDDRGMSDRIVQITNEVLSLKDPVAIFRNRLASDREASGAVDWVHNNMATWLERGLISRPITGPVAMHCDVKNPVCAAFIEKIGYFGLTAYLCETEEDQRFLAGELRGKGWKKGMY